MQPSTLTPQIHGSSYGMHAILNAWFLLHIGKTNNKTDIRKARYWFVNEVMNMVDEKSKINYIKLMERGAQTTSKDKSKSRKAHLCDKFRPLVSNVYH